MNHRPRTAVSPLILLCAAAAMLLAVSLPAAAQIPPAARSAADAAAAAQYRPQIDAFVKQQVERLNDTKTTRAIHEARIQLESQAPGNASASYLQVYAASLNANILPLASSKELMTRLNAAIVVAHVAERARNAELAPAAAKFMADSQDPVALWGVKAAKFIIPVLLNTNGAQDPLTPNLLAVVKKNWFSGAIAYEAYDALRLNTNSPGAGPAAVGPGAAAPPANAAAIKAAVSSMLGLMTFRAELYAKGVPPQPIAETLPIEFLTRSRVWPSLSAAQQGQVLQQTVNIISFAGQHCGVVGADAVAPLATMLQTAGSGVQLIGQATGDAPTTDAGKQLRSIGISTGGGAISTITSAAVAAVTGSPKWKTVLKAPPEIGGAAGNILSPSEPPEDDAAPATTAGGTTGGTGAGAGGTPPKATGAAGGTGAGTGTTGAAGTGAGTTGPGAGGGAPQ